MIFLIGCGNRYVICHAVLCLVSVPVCHGAKMSNRSSSARINKFVLNGVKCIGNRLPEHVAKNYIHGWLNSSVEF